MPDDRARWALFALFLSAAALLAGGGFWAAELRRSYSPIELAYTQSPQSFRVWLAELWRAGPDRTRAVAAIPARLLSTPIGARRRLIAAMMEDAFWDGIAASETGRRALQESLRQAVLRTLEGTPAAGDLWLAAAALHTSLDGFDARAAAYLSASYRFAPREGQVAYARAGLIARVLPVLDGALAEAAAQDLTLIEAEYPQLHRALAPVLQGMGGGHDRR